MPLGANRDQGAPRLFATPNAAKIHDEKRPVIAALTNVTNLDCVAPRQSKTLLAFDMKEKYGIDGGDLMANAT